MLIHHFLENSATLYPDKVAVIHDTGRASYRQLNAQADSLANCLHEGGVAHGDRIALLLENSIDYIIAYYGTLKAGAVAAPLSPGLKPDGLQYLLNDLEPTAIITNFKTERLLKAVNIDFLKTLIIKTPKQKWANTPFKLQTLEECVAPPTPQKNTKGPVREGLCMSMANNIDPNDLSSIIYTSGSTGQPKGVMLSHRNIVSNTNSICQYLSLIQTDIQMVVLPFFYVMGKSLLNTHIAVGGTIVINNRFLYPADVVQQMIDEQVTGFSGVPSTYAYLLNRSPLAACKDKLHALRYCSQAGGHMAIATKRALREALPAHTRIFIMYGATEASARLTYLDPVFFESKMDSIGQPIPNVSIRILDEQGRQVPDGSPGELVAAGPNIMQGYWKAPHDTAHVLDRHGYHTGDIGYRDPDGFLYVQSRKDGLLKVGGHRINPTEVEDYLMSTDLLIEAAVVGLPDPLLGHKLVALVVMKDAATPTRAVMEKCAAGLPIHKVPAEFIVTRTLPKIASGKMDREQCVTLAKTNASQKM